MELPMLSLEDRLNQALAKIIQLYESGASPTDIAAAVVATYGEFAPEFRQVLDAVKQVLPVIAPDLATVLVAVLRLANATMEDPGLVDEQQRLRRNRAKELRNAYQAYLDAGFDETLASQLIVAEVGKPSRNVSFTMPRS